MTWLRIPSTEKTSQVVVKGEYKSGKKMASSAGPTKRDFLPKGILKEIKK